MFIKIDHVLHFHTDRYVCNIGTLFCRPYIRFFIVSFTIDAVSKMSHNFRNILRTNMQKRGHREPGKGKNRKNGGSTCPGDCSKSVRWFRTGNGPGFTVDGQIDHIDENSNDPAAVKRSNFAREQRHAACTPIATRKGIETRSIAVHPPSLLAPHCFAHRNWYTQCIGEIFGSAVNCAHELHCGSSNYILYARDHYDLKVTVLWF